MLKRINIKSLLQAKDSLSVAGFKEFLEHYEIEIRDAEIEDLRYLANALSADDIRTRVFDGYYVGYTIPQIGKEFDLLRFGMEYIVNIELKSTSTEEKIQKQLLRNKYYLNFIGRTVYAFTFVSESKELYFLQEDGQLDKVKVDLLVKLLAHQKMDDSEVLDDLFNPSDYLVSPFNSTKKFLAGGYFLTKQQEDVKSKILGSFKTPRIAGFNSIIGGAGTGKTLLTYDIARSRIEGGGKPLIIHCGQLNDGHLKLIENGWAIIPIKSYSTLSLENFDLVIIDEAQRIQQKQLDFIIEKVVLASCCCIFSHDKRQTLSRWEEKTDISAKIGSIGSIGSIVEYKLSEKIRTNKEIAAFIKMLFNRKRSLPISSVGNIEINYFKTTEDAKSYLDSLDKDRWEILRFTPSQYKNEHHIKYSEVSCKTSHRVIGQEFDGVAVPIDQYFSYDKNGSLIYRGETYYDPPKMLFQNISRCRKRLNLVIIGNVELLSRCIAILR